jgi:3-deoxy-7-phosphoheptulonate synthase
MTNIVDDSEQTHFKRVVHSQILTNPGDMIAQYPCPHDIEQFISKKRREISDIIHGKDDRLLVVIGPCSIHNISEAIEYAKKLSIIAKKHVSTLLIVMRVYFEKPRTTVGWKGLIYDPHLDDTNNISDGLQLSRQLLLTINSLQLPCACEFLQPMIVPYVSDLISWAAIGARTTESQIHRELVSGLNIPIGFKNGSNGCVQTAVDACVASGMPHASLSIDHWGNVVSCYTSGNEDVHVVLRGGSVTGPNYSSKHVMETQKRLNASIVTSKIMIDCSHGNSLKDGERQKHVIDDICQQIAGGDQSIMGVMIESNLVGGRQTFLEGKKHLLKYGQSITDSCLSWDVSKMQLQLLADSVADRRKRNHQSNMANTECVSNTNVKQHQ